MDRVEAYGKVFTRWTD